MGNNLGVPMSPRFAALTETTKRVSKDHQTISASETFGAYVFNRFVMQKMLPKDIYRNILQAQQGLEKIKPEYAEPIAVAMKEWAVSHGATHYTHWFQPLTGASAEKHDAFLDWSSPDELIEKFNGKQLVQGEPDASSFPSGGLRSTYEARGYTGWDPTSPAFVWKAGNSVTLCIPSIFFSWTGDVLDSKIPFLRSERKICQSAMRLLRLTGISANNVFSTLGCEQEYFVIDRALRNLRPDLLLVGRTVCGAPSPKGQELQDHYFGSVKDRILAYMCDFESAALQLGIPVKTRHNEVAPAQHEAAPVFEKSSSAIDHNILLMELMRQIAAKHQLACLLNEKPFNGLNGSGKHCNWSLSTDTGINLLDPSDNPENRLHFLILITAIVNAVHQHSALLRASIGSASNDFRLGGHEAPPAILSVYLGKELETVLENIEEKGSYSREGNPDKYDLGIPILPDMNKDNTDRNRTSPFAFTGNKFEFRAVGSSASPAFPVTVLNAIVAESLDQILDEIEVKIGAGAAPTAKVLMDASIPVIRKYLKQSKNIRFHGDNYSEEWQQEAKRRGLPNIKKSVYAFEALKEKSTINVFQGILTELELRSRYEILSEAYGHTVLIEAKLLLEMFNTQILPAAIRTQKELCDNIKQTGELLGLEKTSSQLEKLAEINDNIELGIECAQVLEKEISKSKTAYDFCDHILPKCLALRNQMDSLEGKTNDQYWPFPKYRELLFMV